MKCKVFWNIFWMWSFMCFYIFPDIFALLNLAVFVNLSIGHVMINLPKIPLNLEDKLKNKQIDTKPHIIIPIHPKEDNRRLTAKPVTINLKEINHIANKNHQNNLINAVAKKAVERAVAKNIKKRENQNMDKKQTKKNKKMVPIYPNFDGVDNDLAVSAVDSSSNDSNK